VRALPGHHAGRVIRLEEPSAVLLRLPLQPLGRPLHLRQQPPRPDGGTDRAILAELEAKLFAPAAVEEGIRQAVEALRPVGDALETRRVAFKVELTEIAEKVHRLTEAIEGGAGEVDALVDALRARQKRQRELQAGLVELEVSARSGGREAAEIERELRA